MGAQADGEGDLPEIDWGAAGIETELGWALPTIYQGYTRSGVGAVAEVPGGPRGYQVLVAITTEEPSSQLALAHRLGIDKTQMTYVIDALETGGFAERRPDPRDRRIRHVLPTEAGQALLHSARAALREAEGMLMRHLTTEEQTQLRLLLARVALGAGEVGPRSSDARADIQLPLASPDRSRRATASSPTDGDTP
ncbi:MarR family winged helix-turn-helix transcriptional regulator [Microbacterium sp. P04]|uniref:MarR family winged helix-turn-helix transcriptional regulator n=1 Tax=Microbacterium sp. P04 TaxID=3366947 RepID=UPI003745EB70